MTERKKIVFVLSGYGREARGAERVVAGMVQHLSAVYDIRVLGSGTDAPNAVPLSFLLRDNAWTRRVNRTPGLGHLARFFQLDPLNWEWLTCAWVARRWLVENPCDLLVPEGGRWGGWLGQWARKHLGIPFVDIAHGAPSRWEMAAARCLPNAYVALTELAAAEMKRRVPPLNVHVIPPGVDTERFTPEGDKVALPIEGPVVMAVGALESMKRMACVIEAVRVWKRGSVLLVGDGPLREELCQFGQTALGPGRFHWRVAKAEDMPALYRSADLLMTTSESEGFSMVYLEAMASGLPIVAHDDASRREMIGPSGWYGDATRPDQMALLLDNALRGHRREEILRRARSLDVRHMSHSYQKLFERVMADPPLTFPGSEVNVRER